MTKEGKKDILILAIIVAVILVSILILISKIKQQIAENPIEQNQEQKQDEYQEQKQDEYQEQNQDEYQEVNEEKNAQTVTESFVGYYADVDGDAVVDGVIYADLSVGGAGGWGAGSEHLTYTIPTIATSELKDYKELTDSYTGKFGTKKVLQAVNPKDTSKKDRFYVMALNDIDNKVNGTYYHWWYSAYDKSGVNDYSEKISTDFGTGYNNTKNMIENWNSSSPYGKHDIGTYKDIWGQIEKQYEKGWFVPSGEEWAAFANAFGLSSSIHDSSFEFSDGYWSSSLAHTHLALSVRLGWGVISSSPLRGEMCVRLSTTF